MEEVEAVEVMAVVAAAVVAVVEDITTTEETTTRATIIRNHGETDTMIIETNRETTIQSKRQGE